MTDTKNFNWILAQLQSTISLAAMEVARGNIELTPKWVVSLRENPNDGESR